jgi:hypothetical protein
VHDDPAIAAVLHDRDVVHAVIELLLAGVDPDLVIDRAPFAQDPPPRD